MAKYNTFGTQFLFDPGTGMVAIAQVKDIGGIDVSADTYERTTHDSVDGIKEKGKGLIDPGETSIELVFDPANTGHAELKLRAESQENVAEDYEIQLPAAAGKTLKFKAFVTGFSSTTPIDGDLMATVKFTISGKTTWEDTV